jgi:2-dehydropantoate 2-reductase
MRILVIGAGAVGGYFGGRLAQAGKDVTFLVRPHRAETLRTHGLRITSPHGDAVVHPKLVAADRLSETYDVVILSVKAYSLEAAMNDCSPAVGPATMILPLLNGMRHLDTLADRFAANSVLGGLCLIVADVTADGRIVQHTEVHRLAFGERGGGITPRIEILDREMQGAPLEARASANIMQEMWEKWVMLASLGGATCLLRGSIGEIEAVPGGGDMARAILDECANIARASGYAPQQAFLERTAKLLTTPGSGLTSSMYRDMSKNARVEVEQILGDLIGRGQKHGLATPFLNAACAQLRIYEARRARSTGL